MNRRVTGMRSWDTSWSRKPMVRASLHMDPTYQRRLARETPVVTRKCCLCAQFKCYPSPRSYNVFSLSLWERVGVRANARIQREAWAPTNSNRYTTNYLHRENVALGLVPSRRRARPLPWCPLTL